MSGALVQQLVAAALVLAAAAYLGRKAWRQLRPKPRGPGCGGGDCGCSH